MMSFYNKAYIIVFQTNYIIIQKEFFIIEFIKQRSYYVKKNWFYQINYKLVINNPVEVERLSTNNSNLKKIVTLGKFVPQKNQALSIEAFSLFEKSHKGHNLHTP